MPDFGIKSSSVTGGIDQRWLHRPADKSADTISVTIDVSTLDEAAGHYTTYGAVRVIPAGLPLAKTAGGLHKPWAVGEELDGFLYYPETVEAGDTAVVAPELVRGVINVPFLPGTASPAVVDAAGAGHFKFVGVEGDES